MIQKQECKMSLKKEKYEISVLIVENDPAILEGLVKLVSKLAKNVYSAKNGKEGLKFFHNEAIDLIISDVDMPLMNGIELLKQIREENQKIPFVLSTGLKSLEVVTSAIEYGITAFLPKPIQKQKLIKKIENITQKKKLRMDLKESQEVFKQYQHAIDESALVSKTDLKGVITYANDLFCELSGYSREELIGKSHNIVRHESMSVEVFREMWRTIKSKNIWHGTINNRAKNGNMYTVKSTIVPILNSAGNITEYIAIREDVTQAIKKDNELEIERKRLHKILNNMENVVAMSTQGKQLVFTNHKFFEIFGYQNLADFLEGHSCVCDLFEKETGYLQKIMDDKAWGDYVIDNPEMTHKALMIDKNGFRRIYAVKVNKIIEKDDYFYLLTLNDITEIDKLRVEAENAAQAKGEFLANMSHEIRTPMNGILGFTKLLEQTTLDEKQKRYLQIIDGSTNTLLGIINDILDFSKLQSGKFELDETRINPFIEFEILP